MRFEEGDAEAILYKYGIRWKLHLGNVWEAESLKPQLMCAHLCYTFTHIVAYTGIL